MKAAAPALREREHEPPPRRRVPRPAASSGITIGIWRSAGLPDGQSAISLDDSERWMPSQGRRFLRRPAPAGLPQDVPVRLRDDLAPDVEVDVLFPCVQPGTAPVGLQHEPPGPLVAARDDPLEEGEDRRMVADLEPSAREALPDRLIRSMAGSSAIWAARCHGVCGFGMKDATLTFRLMPVAARTSRRNSTIGRRLVLVERGRQPDHEVELRGLPPLRLRLAQDADDLLQGRRSSAPRAATPARAVSTAKVSPLFLTSEISFKQAEGKGIHAQRREGEGDLARRIAAVQLPHQAVDPRKSPEDSEERVIWR